MELLGMAALHLALLHMHLTAYPQVAGDTSAKKARPCRRSRRFPATA